MAESKPLGFYHTYGSFLYAEGVLVRALARSKPLGFCLARIVPLFLPEVFWFEPWIGRSVLAFVVLIVSLFTSKVFWFEP